jgi:hypothetical protein
VVLREISIFKRPLGRLAVGQLAEEARRREARMTASEPALSI